MMMAGQLREATQKLRCVMMQTEIELQQADRKLGEILRTKPGLRVVK